MQRGESYLLTFFSLWVIRDDHDDALTHPATRTRMDVPYLLAKKDRWSSWLWSLISGPSKVAEEGKRKKRERERRRRRRLTAMGRLAASPHHESFHKRNSGFNPKVWTRSKNRDRSTSTTHKKEIANYLHQRIKIFSSSSPPPPLLLPSSRQNKTPQQRRKEEEEEEESKEKAPPPASHPRRRFSCRIHYRIEEEEEEEEIEIHEKK